MFWWFIFFLDFFFWSALIFLATTCKDWPAPLMISICEQSYWLLMDFKLFCNFSQIDVHRQLLCWEYCWCFSSLSWFSIIDHLLLINQCHRLLALVAYCIFLTLFLHVAWLLLNNSHTYELYVVCDLELICPVVGWWGLQIFIFQNCNIWGYAEGVTIFIIIEIQDIIDINFLNQFLR